MLRLLRNGVRGAIAWIIGYVLTAVFVASGAVDSAGGVLGGTARIYLTVHTAPFDSEPWYLVALPIAALTVVGYRSGKSLGSGVTGRLRTAVQSVRGTETNRLRRATETGGLLAVGYTAIGTVVALLTGVSPVEAVLGCAVVGLMIAVPAAVGGAYD